MESLITPFSFYTNPRVEFGAGKIKTLAKIINEMGENILLVTGSASFRNSEHYTLLLEDLDSFDIRYYEISVEGEPSTDFVDQAVKDFGEEMIHAVVAVGGGSVMDAGKAISAMIPQDGKVEDYLEGIGKKTHDGTKVPFIAVPTTAGTGSEATKNAVLSKIGKNGFKKSLRHDNLIPDIALIDPELTLSCSPDITAACGMDALTQLLEAYVSTKSNAMTDALAESGLKAVGLNLEKAYNTPDLNARTQMAYAAYLSGLCLANAGLGTVHGIAGAFGGLYPVPHGVICGSLLNVCVRKNIEVLLSEKNNPQSLLKYAQAGYFLAGKPFHSQDEGILLLVEKLTHFTEVFGMPLFSQYGIKPEEADVIAALSDNKNNPALLTKDQISSILKERF